MTTNNTISIDEVLSDELNLVEVCHVCLGCLVDFLVRLIGRNANSAHELVMELGELLLITLEVRKARKVTRVEVLLVVRHSLRACWFHRRTMRLLPVRERGHGLEQRIQQTDGHGEIEDGPPRPPPGRLR